MGGIGGGCEATTVYVCVYVCVVFILCWPREWFVFGGVVCGVGEWSLSTVLLLGMDVTAQ